MANTTKQEKSEWLANRCMSWSREDLIVFVRSTLEADYAAMSSEDLSEEYRIETTPESK